MTTYPDPVRRGGAVFFDNEADVKLLLQWVLPRLGWEALSAGSGEATLALIEAAPAPLDCLLLDVSRTHWAGLALASQVAVRAPELPIILMSSADQIALPAELGRSVIGVLWKPFSIGELELLLEQAQTLRLAAQDPQPPLWYERPRLLTLPARAVRRTAEV